tara:strand:- start:172 stop:315 length:144 start_codon:yes stop_codon:yes gene_type:complete
MKMKSDYQINRERQKKQREKIKWMFGWILISLIVTGGIFCLMWIEKL